MVVIFLALFVGTEVKFHSFEALTCTKIALSSVCAVRMNKLMVKNFHLTETEK